MTLWIVIFLIFFYRLWLNIDIYQIFDVYLVKEETNLKYINGYTLIIGELWWTTYILQAVMGFIGHHEMTASWAAFLFIYIDL